MSIAIVGAGLSGLAAALELEEQGQDFVLFEAAERVGGVVGSLRTEGYLLELGPRTVPSSAPTLERMIDAAGLSDGLLTACPEANRRFIWSGGRLHLVPMAPSQLLSSSLLSFAGRLRVLGDLFLPRGDGSDETVAEFLTRRFGAEASRRLGDPFCAGTFGGTPERLGIEALGRASALESEHGSLLRGMGRIAKQNKAAGKPPHTLISFAEGLQELTDALAGRFAERIRLGTPIDSLQGVDADRVIVATPPSAAAALLKEHSEEAAEIVGGIRRVPLAVVAIGVEEGACEHPLDGFGFLCCSDSPLAGGGSVLGGLFSSSIFPGRAPEGRVLIEVMIGGDRAPEALAASDEELIELALAACAHALGLSGPPEFSHVTRWPPVLPQFERGHGRRVERLRGILAESGRVALAGNYLDGVGVESAALSGVVAARSFR